MNMKKFARILAVVMAVLMVSLCFVACGNKLSGTYEHTEEAMGITATVKLEFDGDKVKISSEALGISASVDATYEIKDDEITISIDDEDSLLKDLAGTFDFEKGKDYVKIDGTEYKKAD